MTPLINMRERERETQREKAGATRPLRFCYNIEKKY